MRDYSREFAGDRAALSRLQRSIVNCIVNRTPSAGWESPAADEDGRLKQYVGTNISHHISEGLVGKLAYDDKDVVKWLESSDDSFVGLIAVQTALYLGSSILEGWSQEPQRQNIGELLAAKLLTCSAVALLSGIGMWGVHEDGRDQALALLVESIAQFHETKDRTSKTWEFHCHRQFIQHMQWSHPDFADHADKAVELANTGISLNPIQMCALGVVIQFQGQALMDVIAQTAGQHLDEQCCRRASSF